MFKHSCLILVLLQQTLASDYQTYCTHEGIQKEIPRLSYNQPLWKDTSIKLVQTQILIRHGARTPYNGKRCWANYNITWTCNIRDHVSPAINQDKESKAITQRVFAKIYDKGTNVLDGNCMEGQLLDEGFRQETRNGQNFRKAYVAPEELDAKDKSSYYLFQSDEKVDLSRPSDFHLESDDFQRTIMSGQIVIDSMFPVPNGDDTLLQKPIPWHLGDQSRSPYTPNRYCPRISSIGKHIKDSDEYQKWRYSDKYRKLDTNLEKALTSYDDASIFDCLMTAKCSNSEIPPGVSEDMIEQVAIRANEESVLMNTYNNSMYSKLSIAPLLKSMRNRMIERTKSVDASETGPRLALYSGHDSTIWAFLPAIGGKEWYQKWPRYASYVSIELYQINGTLLDSKDKKKTSEFSDYFVRIVNNGEVKKLPGCNDDICLLKKFFDLTAFAEMDMQCDAVERTSVFSHLPGRLTKQAWIIIFVSLIFSGVLVGCICACCRRQRHSIESNLAALQEKTQNLEDDKKAKRTLLRVDGTPDDTASEFDSQSEAGDRRDRLSEDDEIEVEISRVV